MKEETKPLLIEQQIEDIKWFLSRASRDINGVISQSACRSIMLLVEDYEARAKAGDKCPGRDHRDHASVTCDRSCCTNCGGPIDEDSECRCQSEGDK